ncbi:MAG: murein L,D-transpeptidase catalytic domain family protein [Pseudomonadota bacterium]|nr:murein L,D-transpeptidase catalytic domain family protein [Pseudomonadota bacterium]
MPRLHLIFLALIAAALTSCSGQETRPTAVVPTVIATPPLVPTLPAPDRNADLVQRLHRLAPDADPGVIALAVESRACALKSGNVHGGSRMAVIDYTRPSTQKRMWVFDLDRSQLLYSEHVAHGRGSGENYATSFSNRDSSYQTSLGLFSTNETYVGGNGYSLRMDGLEPGINDNARDRLIVMHGAPYVDPGQAQRQGRLGRSFGCPAVRPQVARQVIDTLKQGQMLFAYADEATWLSGSRWFGCSGRNARDILASARNGRGGSGNVVAAAH